MCVCAGASEMAANDRHAVAEARQSATNMAKKKNNTSVTIDKCRYG